MTADVDFESLLGSTAPAQKMPPTRALANSEFTEGELASLWGVSTRQVRKLREESVIQCISRGRFDAAECTRIYIAHLVATAKRRGTADPELRAEKLRLTRAQAEAQEVKTAAARRELVPVSEVRAEWLSLAADLRSALLAVPGRVTARLSLERTAAIALDEEIRLALETLNHGQ